MWPGNGVLGTRRTRSGIQLAPGIQKCGLGMVFCWLRAVKMWLLAVQKESPRFSPASPGSCPDPLWGIRMLSFDPTRNLSVFAV
eukprot:2630420-Pyramimonas_sp.AAC.1